MIGRFAKVLAALAGLSTAATAQRAPFAIPDPDPEVERRSFQVAEGFEVNLFAADPLLAKPIQMNWDAAGRLWVVSSEVYPQIAPGQVANDKVLVLEDTDGDGRADKTTVFAEGLLIPTGIEPGDGGAYVANSTEVVHLADTDGDGRADKRQVLLSGFGTEDTHHIIHTFRWGPEGRLYFNQSIYIHSHIETPWGVRRLGGSGIWQFRPDSRRLEVTMRGLVNPWGHVFDRWGRRFATDGAGGEGINDVVFGASYATAVGASRILPGLNPGSPKHCGLEVLSGRHFPEEYRGSLVTNDFRGNRVCRFVLSEDGSSYSSREQPELLKTSYVSFRPIDLKMGPDGALYVADWFNPIIQHGEVDFRDPRRDHTRGRIWRITAKGRPLVPRPKLVDATVPELLEALKAPEDWTRHFAKRVLFEKHGPSIVPRLVEWVAKLDRSDQDHDHHRLEALWVHQGVDHIDPALLSDLLRSSDPRVRQAVAPIVADWADRLTEPRALLTPLVDDEHPRVRLEAVRALGRIPGVESVQLALRALDRPIDRNLDYGLWLTCRDLEMDWLPSVREGKLDFDGKTNRLLFGLRAVGSPSVVQPIVDLIRQGKVPATEEQGALTLLANLGGPRELSFVFDLAQSGELAPARRAALLNALLQSQSRRKARPEGDLARLARSLDDRDASVRVTAARLAGAWGLHDERERLLGWAKDDQSSADLAGAALDGLAALGDDESMAAIAHLSETAQSFGTRSRAIVALLAARPEEAATRAVALLTAAGPGSRPGELVQAFRERKGATALLAKALKGASVPPDLAKLALREVGGAGQADPALIEALKAAGKLEAVPPPPTGAELEALVAEVRERGEAARGEAIYRRPSATCMNCHAIAGAGGRVGPDLASVGASAPIDYLVDSLYQPNKAVKEGYHSLVVATTSGKVITGVKQREADGELVLRDADDREVVVPSKDIEESKQGGSLMPAGLVDTLTREEVVDLTRFLAELGKVGPYSVGQARLARRWQVLEATPENINKLRRTRFDTAATDPDLRWVPAYSRVDGTLPMADIPTMKPRELEGTYGFARTEIDVTTAGQIKLKVAERDGLTLWVDGRPVGLNAETMLELSQGKHVLTFSHDASRPASGLRCELVDVPDSPARAAWVLGK